MPLEQGERRTDYSAGVAAVSRRAAIRAALGAWLGAQFGVTRKGSTRPDPVATPTSGQAVATPPGISLPDGITLASEPRPLPGHRRAAARFDSFDRARVSAIFNPSAFQQDPQIPLSYLESLVRPDPATMRPTPWLAERWEWRDQVWSSSFAPRRRALARRSPADGRRCRIHF